jgi:hypothetical protein
MPADRHVLLGSIHERAFFPWANKRQPTPGWSATARVVLFHPDYTVGSGISPDLLTFRQEVPEALAGSRIAPDTAGGEFHPALRTFQT